MIFFFFNKMSNNFDLSFKINKFLLQTNFKKLKIKINENKMNYDIYKKEIEIKKYSNLIYMEFDIFNKSSYFLDISNNIDNINVEIEIIRIPLKKTKREIYRLVVTPLYFENLKPFKYESNIFEFAEINRNINNDIKYFYNFMKKIILKMNELKFNLLYNKFTTELEEEKIKLESIIFKKFYDTENCCICIEETTCKTICNHTICLKCYNSLVNKSDTDIIKCPICRNILRDYNFDLEDEEEYGDEDEDEEGDEY